MKSLVGKDGHERYDDRTWGMGYYGGSGRLQEEEAFICAGVHPIQERSSLSGPKLCAQKRDVSTPSGSEFQINGKGHLWQNRPTRRRSDLQDHTWVIRTRCGV